MLDTQTRFFRLQVEVGHRWNPQTQAIEAVITEIELPHYVLNYDTSTGLETGRGQLPGIPTIVKVSLVNPPTAAMQAKLTELAAILPTFQQLVTELGLLQVEYLQSVNSVSNPEGVTGI